MNQLCHQHMHRVSMTSSPDTCEPCRADLSLELLPGEWRTAGNSYSHLQAADAVWAGGVAATIPQATPRDSHNPLSGAQ